MIFRVVAIVLPLLVLSAFTGYKIAHHYAPLPHAPMRIAAIESQAALAHAGTTLLIGDSLVEQAYIPTLCNSDVLNAGISGAGIKDVTAVTPRLIGKFRPKLIVINVGVNDALPAATISVEEWRSELDGLVSMAISSGAAVAIMTISPVRSDEPYKLDMPKIAKIDAAIRQISEQRHAVLIDQAATLAGPDGQMPKQLTVDGVHLTTAGYDLWIATTSQAACHPQVAG